MASKKNKKLPVDESSGFGLNLGALLQAKGVETQTSEPIPTQSDSPDPSEATDESVDLSTCGKLILRHERKGRSGKTVTVVRGFSLSDTQLREVARQMRRALGCGAGVEQADRIVLQGEQLERARVWLEQQGVRQVVLGTRR